MATTNNSKIGNNYGLLGLGAGSHSTITGTNTNFGVNYNSTGTATYTIKDYSTIPQSYGKNFVVKGDADFQGELSIKGVNLSERLDKIEERLGILHPNKELEEKWENLRGLRNAYLELEKEIIEKEKIWATLKG